MKQRLKRAAIAVTGAALLLSAAAAGAQLIAMPVATVSLHRPQIISSPQFKAFAGMTARQGGTDTIPPDQCRPVLDALIDQRLIEQEGAQRRLTPTDAEVDQQIIAQRKEIEQNVDRELTDELWWALIGRDTGLTPTEYRERIIAWIVTQRVAAQMRPGRMDAVQPPSEEEIRTFYDVNIQRFVQPDLALVRHVFFQTDGLDAAGANQARQRAAQALQELRDGASFDDLVAAYSDDPSSRYRGGEIGNRYLRRDDAAAVATLGAAFLQEVFAMQPGDAERLVESVIGVHIVKVAERTAARLLTLDDPVTPRSPQTVRGQIAAVLAADLQQRTAAQVTQEIIEELREMAAIEIMEDNLAAVCPSEAS